jgi:hypothetical protein
MRTGRGHHLTYTDVVLTEPTKAVSIAIGGTFTPGCLLPRVRGL